jgi:arginyl-tRNA synthetase
VRELAAAVHGFYHDCPIHKGGVEPSVRDARWWLAESAAIGLRAGLGVLGVSAPREM